MNLEELKMQLKEDKQKWSEAPAKKLNELLTTVDNLKNRLIESSETWKLQQDAAHGKRLDDLEKMLSRELERQRLIIKKMIWVLFGAGGLMIGMLLIFRFLPASMAPVPIQAVPIPNLPVIAAPPFTVDQKGLWVTISRNTPALPAPNQQTKVLIIPSTNPQTSKN